MISNSDLKKEVVDILTLLWNNQSYTRDNATKEITSLCDKLGVEAKIHVLSLGEAVFNVTITDLDDKC